MLMHTTMNRERYAPSTKQSPSIPYRLVSLLPYLLAILYGIFTAGCGSWKLIDVYSQRVNDSGREAPNGAMQLFHALAMGLPLRRVA
jgi:hypothetical protein